MKHFAHLHCHSHFSFHAGTISPDALVALTANYGMPAVALTDHNGLYGSVIFYKKASEAGIKPILGIEITHEDSRTTLDSRRSPLDAQPSTLDAVILAKDYFGYSQLCKIATERQLNPEFSFIHCLKKHYEEGLAKDNECHFIVLTHEPELAKELSSFLDKHHLYIEINPSMKQSVSLLHLAESLKRKVVISGNVYFAAPQDYEIHRILRAIGELKTVHSKAFDFIAPKSGYFMRPDELHNLFSLCPNALDSTQEIIERCNVKLSLKEYKFPKFTVPPGETSYSYLWKICFEGAIQRYGILTRAVMGRLSMELQVIEQLGFADYFLLVRDVVEYAKSKRIPSIGRGSAANSIVSYVLGITHVEPISNNLYFERFLNSERKSPPDIDVDFCWKRRDDVLKYVYEKYGNDRVAMISTYVRFSARSLFREIGKAMGVPEQELNKFTSRLPHFFHGNQIEEAIERIPECRTLPIKEEPFNRIFEHAQKLNGAPQHLSIHAGGIVVSPATITDYVALEKASKGFVITQYDMFSIEDIGLVKIDLLSQRSLSVYADTKANIEGIYHITLPEDMETYYHDEATKTLIREGKTIGCFYIESPAMRQLLKKLKVDTFPMLTAASSVIRPGVAESGMMQQYIRRHHHREPASYLHPRMKEILYETYGVMIYQEDVIRVAHKVIGLSLQEADLLRRAMSGKERSHDVMQKLEIKFAEKAINNGIAKEVACEIWRQISSFAGYAFCKAHSASYAQLSFKVAYLKAHFPAEFMASVLSNQGGFYHPSVYVSEARSMGLWILLPDINRSEYWYTAEEGKTGYRGNGVSGRRGIGDGGVPESWRGRRNTVRIGFVQVKHLSRKTIEAILSKRKNGNYKSLEDFLMRVDVPYSEAEILIKIGALDSLILQSPLSPVPRFPDTPLPRYPVSPFPLSRPQLLWKLKTAYPLIQKWKLKKNGVLDETYLPQTPVPDLPEYSIEQKLNIEEEYLDMMVSAHPLSRHQKIIQKYSVVASIDFQHHLRKTVNAAGWLVALKRINTSKGDYMLFISFEDFHGFYEITLFPRAYSRYGSCLTDRGPYLVTGKISDDFGCISIIAERIRHM